MYIYMHMHTYINYVFIYVYIYIFIFMNMYTYMHTYIYIYDIYSYDAYACIYMHMRYHIYAQRDILIYMTVSTENATSPKSTRSSNSDSSVSYSTTSNWDFGLVWICPKEFEFLDFGRFLGCSNLSGIYHIYIYFAATFKRDLRNCRIVYIKSYIHACS